MLLAIVKGLIEQVSSFLMLFKSFHHGSMVNWQ